MGLQLKEEKRAKANTEVTNEAEKIAVKIPYFMIQSIGALIGKFRCATFDDFEFIQKKKEALNKEMQNFSQKIETDKSKVQEVWQGDSELSKNDFAWLPKDVFKAKVAEMNLTADEVGVLQFWVVKED